MNFKQYQKLHLYFTLEQNYQDTNDKLLAFQNVQKGSFTMSDLDIVFQVLNEENKEHIYFHSSDVNEFVLAEKIEYLESKLEQEKHDLKEVEKNLKKSGVNLELMRKQMRLHQEKEFERLPY